MSAGQVLFTLGLLFAVQYLLFGSVRFLKKRRKK